MKIRLDDERYCQLGLPGNKVAGAGGYGHVGYRRA